MSGFAIPFADHYRNLLLWLLSVAAVEERNERTGRKVRVGRGGTSFRINLHDRILPTCGLRKTFPKSAAAEVAWYLHGTQDVTWMRKHAPFWDKFTEEDRTTVTSAYGYRWREHFGRDQIALAIEALRADSSDRRAFISAWDPGLDGLGAVGQRNVPCPVGFNLMVLDGELHSTVFLRSSDALVGLPYDVMGHALLMDAIATDLGVALGFMQVSIGHLHLYEDHYEIALEALEQRAFVCPQLVMPGWGVDTIVQRKDEYVQLLAEASRQFEWPTYNPKPFVVE
jgi:thymidylate synthase